MGQLCLSCSHMAGSDTPLTDNRGHEFKFSVITKKKKYMMVTVSENGTKADVYVVNVFMLEIAWRNIPQILM